MERKDNKENDILKAAEILFAEKGFKGATTTMIAAEAGVTHAMLHYYFRTKEHIFLKVLDLYMDKIWVDLKAIMVPDIYDVELIRKVTEIIFDFFNEHRNHVNLLLEVAKDRPDILDTYMKDSKKYLGTSLGAHSERIVKAVKEGRIREITFRELLVDIIVLCAAPFFFDPVLFNLIGMDGAQREAFLESRKKEAVEMITSRLRIVDTK